MPTRDSRRQKAENRKQKLKIITIAIASLAIICLAFCGFLSWKSIELKKAKVTALDIPEYSGQPYAIINDNVPFFDDSDKNTNTFESYSDLDSLGRCQVAYANISRELMPTGERGEIGSIKPSGWNQAKYEGVIDSSPAYLYNRCHLIAYCLTAENANEKNLITGTRYMNVNGMLPFEEQVAKYLDIYDNHVLYRVTPIYEGRNLVASGVLMEAYSVEDEGEGISFCVYCYNVQPGVEIDYRTGKSWLESNEG
jgi:DNA-entry nuclease